VIQCELDQKLAAKEEEQEAHGKKIRSNHDSLKNMIKAKETKIEEETLKVKMPQLNPQNNFLNACVLANKTAE
jgi:hypothetical protein